MISIRDSAVDGDAYAVGRSRIIVFVTRIVMIYGEYQISSIRDASMVCIKMKSLHLVNISAGYNMTLSLEHKCTVVPSRCI